MKKHKLWRWVLGVLGAGVLLLAMTVLAGRFWLKTTRYTVTLPQLESQVRLVYLSDLHGLEYGKDNRRLLEKVRQAQPDLIATVGDMVPKNASEEEIDAYCDLLTELTRIAPVYVSLGNVELELDADLPERIRQTGAVFLDETYEDITINGETLRVGGLYRYAFRHAQTQEQWLQSSTYGFLTDFQDTSAVKILLCHRPDCFFFYDAYDDWDVDVILCGHTHGGVVRLPLLGGLCAPDQGWLPEYDKGLFSFGDTHMLITSGFAGYDGIPRIFNRPEIVCVTLCPE